MKGLVWNCQSVHWRYDVDKHKATKCLLVYVCCEKGDTMEEAKEVVRRIHQLNKKRYNKEHIVIFPFAHMSNHIMSGDEAKMLILEIMDRLSKTAYVHVLGFNKKKEIKIHLLPANADVSFFSY